MLKVVGASWLQTRLSSCLLVAVSLIGLGAVILSEYGRVEMDGTYSATVWWKRKTGYRIDFWGQGNDLTTLPVGVARAYYKPDILETGWSIVEIETSPDYPDDVQAYAAGLLEGSLTWQLIYHHWYNTVRAACAPRAALCRRMRHYLQVNAASARENAALRRHEDPFWHMVHLYYTQLNGLVEGWRFAVERSRQDVDIGTEDFLWLAMASDLPDLERANNGSAHHIYSDGMIFLKSIPREDREPLLVLAHNTAAPYARMLRLIKRYDFAYHVSPEAKSARVPGQSIVMTSYPGALSSQDESYAITEPGGRELIVAGTPLVIDNKILWNRVKAKDQVMSAGRIMAANRLATDGLTWSHYLDRQNSGTANRQWIGVEPRNGRISLIEQIPGFMQHVYRTNEFWADGFLACTGAPYTKTIRDLGGGRDESVARAEVLALLQANITDIGAIRNLMRGEIKGFQQNEESKDPQSTVVEGITVAPYEDEESSEQLLAYRGDLANVPRPVGVVDSKLFLFNLDGSESFEARSGPARRSGAPAFDWSTSFPNSSHIGQPEKFKFDSVSPQWVWV